MANATSAAESTGLSYLHKRGLAAMLGLPTINAPHLSTVYCHSLCRLGNDFRPFLDFYLFDCLATKYGTPLSLTSTCLSHLQIPSTCRVQVPFYLCQEIRNYALVNLSFVGFARNVEESLLKVKGHPCDRDRLNSQKLKLNRSNANSVNPASDSVRCRCRPRRRSTRDARQYLRCTPIPEVHTYAWDALLRDTYPQRIRCLLGTRCIAVTQRLWVSLRRGEGHDYNHGYRGP